MAYIGRNPAIGTQKVLDSLESQFNGVLTTFDLRYNTNTIYPTIASALIVSLGGVLQEPGSAYNVASDQITFAEAPPTGADCWILLYSEFGGVSGASPNLTVGNSLTVQGNTDLDGAIDIDAGQVTYTASSNIAKFADNAKLVFGDSDDLQIYHDGSNSYIDDIGAGQFYIRGSAAIHLENSAGTEKYARFVQNAAAELYFDNSRKFETTSTGATVTGTALATSLSTGASGTGINISTNTISGPATLTIDPAAVGDNTGTVIIAGGLQVDGTTTTINSTTLTVDDKNIVLASGAANAAAADGAGITVDGAAATLLYKSTLDAWSFNKNVGIGTNNPVAKLTVYSTSSDLLKREIRIDATSAPSGGSSAGIFRIVGNGDAAGKYLIGYNNNHTSQSNELSLKNADGDITLFTAVNVNSLSEKVRITSSGNVGINEATNINGRLHVQHNAQAENILYATRHNDQANDKPILAITEATMTGMILPGLVIGNHNRDIHIGQVFGAGAAVDTSHLTGIRIKADGNIGIGTNNPDTLFNLFGTGNTTIKVHNNSAASGTYSRLQLITGGTGSSARSEIRSLRMSTTTSATNLAFFTTVAGATSPTERLRITSDGNVGIGTDNPQGKLHISSGTSGDADLILEADTANINESYNPKIVFRQDGGLNLGSIGMNITNSSLVTPSNELYIAASSGDAAIVFATGTSGEYTNATEKVRIDSSGTVGIEGNVQINGGVLTSLLTAVIADDAYLDVVMPVKGGIIAITSFTIYDIYPQPNGTGLIYYDAGTSKNSSVMVDVSNTLETSNNTATTAGTFTDGKTTIVMANTTGTIRIWNRMNNARQYKITLL